MALRLTPPNDIARDHFSRIQRRIRRRILLTTDDDKDKDNKIHDANSRSVVIKKAFDGMILYTFALYNNFTFSSSRSSFPRKTSSFFLFWYEPTENHTHHRIKRIMSDEEFDLKKKKKKSKKVDFDAFETEDTPNDGDAGVAAAVAEKIEDLDRTCVSCFSLVLGFSLSSFFFIRFFLC